MSPGPKAPFMYHMYATYNADKSNQTHRPSTIPTVNRLALSFSDQHYLALALLTYICTLSPPATDSDSLCSKAVL